MLRGGGARIGWILAALALPPVTSIAPSIPPIPGWGPSPARAESTLRLELPDSYGAIPASTYDEDGDRVGGAKLRVDRLDSGHVQLYSECGIEGGARTIAKALLEPIDDGRALRLLSQESRSFLANGEPLGLLRVDHRAGIASCTGGNGDAAPTRLPVPETDRVANIPLNLLFLPLVRGDVETVNFQLFLCRAQRPRFLDFEAHVARRDNGTGRKVVEVRYSPDLGGMLSIVARNFVPRLSFWFDADAGSPWLGHRLPLYSKGPEVTVIREGVPPRLLHDD